MRAGKWSVATHRVDVDADADEGRLERLLGAAVLHLIPHLAGVRDPVGHVAGSFEQRGRGRGREGGGEGRRWGRGVGGR